MTMQPAGKKKKTCGSEAQFPGKLHDMMSYVEREGLEHIISWVLSGRGFKIHDPNAIVDILPLFFGQTKYRSFQRQLNMWHFKRIPNGPNKGSFIHPYFVRGNKEMCGLMSRQIFGSCSKIKQSPASPKSTEFDVQSTCTNSVALVDIATTSADLESKITFIPEPSPIAAQIEATLSSKQLPNKGNAEFSALNIFMQNHYQQERRTSFTRYKSQDSFPGSLMEIKNERHQYPTSETISTIPTANMAPTPLRLSQRNYIPNSFCASDGLEPMPLPINGANTIPRNNGVMEQNNWSVIFPQSDTFGSDFDDFEFRHS